MTVLDVSYPQPNTDARSRGFADGLRELPAERYVLYRVDGHGLRETARRIVSDALAVHPEIDVIFGINDDSTLGALDAYRDAMLDDRRLLLASFGLEGNAVKELMEQGTPYTVSVAMFPELVGRACVDAAVCACHGCSLPERVITPFTVVTPETLAHFYQRGGTTADRQRQLYPTAPVPPPPAAQTYRLRGDFQLARVVSKRAAQHAGAQPRAGDLPGGSGRQPGHGPGDRRLEANHRLYGRALRARGRHHYPGRRGHYGVPGLRSAQ